MLRRIEVFSRCFTADKNNICHIYEDGILLAVSVIEQTHQRVFPSMQEQYSDIETALSPDGLTRIYLIPGLDNCQTLEEALNPGAPKPQEVSDEEFQRMVETLGQPTVSIPGPMTPAELMGIHPLTAITSHYHDHRWDDRNTLKAAEKLFRDSLEWFPEGLPPVRFGFYDKKGE